MGRGSGRVGRVRVRVGTRRSHWVRVGRGRVGVGRGRVWVRVGTRRHRVRVGVGRMHMEL